MSMTAVILAAGRGSRLSSLTDEPKCLLRLNGHSLLERHLRLLAGVGVERAIVVVGYRQERVREHVAGLRPEMEVHYVENREYEQRGNGYSLYQGLAAATGPALIIDGDLVYTPDIIAGFLNGGALDRILVGPSSLDDIECAKTLVDADNRVRNLIDKRAVRPEDAGEFLGEAIGLLTFSEAGRQALLATAAEFFGRPENLILNWEHLLNVYLQRRCMMAQFEASNQWIEIDTPEDFAAAERKFAAE